MHGIITASISVFIGVFAIMNPIANTAVFVRMTREFDDKQRKKLALRLGILVFIDGYKMITAQKKPKHIVEDSQDKDSQKWL